MAIKIADILHDILLDQSRRTIDNQEAMQRILDAVRKQVVSEIASMPAGSYTGYYQQQMLTQINRLLNSAENDMRTVVSKGINDSLDAGKGLVIEMADAGSGIRLMTPGISTNVVDQIKEFSWGKVSSITNDAQAKIRAELSLGLLGQQTPQEVAAGIAGSLERPGVFKTIDERAQVVAKTEMGRTFSMASQASMEDAAETLPEMQKMWLHAGHPKMPRVYHLNLDGETKPVDEPFLVGNISMMYPRDPSAPVSEIINCGCMNVPYMESWGAKEDFQASWVKAQTAANKPRKGA